MTTIATCIACNAPLGDGRYCSACGTDQRKDEQRVTDRRIRGVLLAFALVMGYILVINLVPFPRTPAWELLQDAVFFVVVCATVWYDRKALAPCLSFRRFTWSGLAVALGLQAVLTTFTLVMVHGLGPSHIRDMVAPFRDHPWPYTTALLSIAVLPALSEELAFRAVFFTRLTTLMPMRAAIIVSGCVFAWIHFSFIGMLWLFPAGLLLGWLRARHGVIWYGVLCHFAHNATMVLLTL